MVGLTSPPPSQYAHIVSILTCRVSYCSDYFYLFHTSLSLVFVGFRLSLLLHTPPYCKHVGRSHNLVCQAIQSIDISSAFSYHQTRNRTRIDCICTFPFVNNSGLLPELLISPHLTYPPYDLDCLFHFLKISNLPSL